MKEFEGKKLLMLGSSAGTVDLIKYAQEKGAFVYVADYYDESRSAAKQYADASIMVSTADTEALEKLIKELEIDCVYAGVSEFNLLQAMRLAERCRLPFYCDESQWAALSDKGCFRKLCVAHHVPSPNTYYLGKALPERIRASLSYPVVVKPVDSAASVGVTICDCEAGLDNALKNAIKNSASGKIIVEEFAQGFEFTAHYTIFKGRASLSCIDNRYPTAVHEGSVTTIPAARIYPSLFADRFIEQVDPPLVSLLESLQLQYAVAFVQGIYNPQTDKFYIFEGALRSAGECPYRYIERINGLNYATMVLDSMMGSPDHLSSWGDDPHMGGFVCGVVSFVARHGTVAGIEGLSTIEENVDDIIAVESRYPVGSTTPDGDTLHQIMTRFFLICESRRSMAEDIAFINSHVDVVDASGRSLAIKFDPARLQDLA